MKTNLNITCVEFLLKMSALYRIVNILDKLIFLFEEDLHTNIKWIFDIKGLKCLSVNVSCDQFVCVWTWTNIKQGNTSHLLWEKDQYFIDLVGEDAVFRFNIYAG